MRNHQRPKSPYIVAHWFATRFCFDLGLTTFKGLSSYCHVHTYILALQRSDRPFLMLCERRALSTKLFEWNPRTPPKNTRPRCPPNISSPKVSQHYSQTTTLNSTVDEKYPLSKAMAALEWEMISQFRTVSSDVSRRRISSTIRREGEFFAQRMSS